MSDRKILLNPLTQAMVDAIKREEFAKLPAVNVLTCGGCGCNQFMMFETGDVACGNCHEKVAGVRIAADNHRAMVTAIEYATRCDDGVEMLRLWMVGEFDAFRSEWPDAPEEMFPGVVS